MLELRFKLQKNHISKTSEERKKVKRHTCALEHTFVQKSNKNPKTHSKFKKNQKNISLNQFQILKFLTIKFLRCNIYQISNDNINYVPKAKFT